MNLKFIERPDGATIGFYHWNLLGLWFEGKPKIYYLYSFILHFVITYFYSISMFLSLFIESDLNNTTEGIYQSFTDLAYLFKINAILVYQKSYRELYKTLYIELKIINEDDLYEKELIERGQKRSKRLFYTVLTSYFTAVLFLLIKPLFSKDQELPYKTVYPFEWKGTTYLYYAAYIYQGIGVTIQVGISAGVDTIPCSVMILLCEYCEVISYNMKNLGISKYSNTDKSRYEVLQRMSQNYIILNRILKQLSNGFSAIIFTQFCMSTVVMCTTAFHISIVSFADQKVEFVFMVTYMIAMIIQVFIPCYYGNELFLKSASLTNSLFNSNWINFDPKFNKNIIIFMEFLKKPLILVGGGIIEMKLTAFLATINFAYSIYNLLHRIQNKLD